MESAWYLSPGQTLENTKIEDRGHALHASKGAWAKITSHLDRKKNIQQAIEKEQAHRKAMKEGSQGMTASWDNSVENIRKRKEESRKARLEKEQEDRIATFLKVTAEQEEIRQEYIDNARRNIYIRKGYPRALNGARLLSEVMYEREKQRELAAALRKHEKEEDANYAAKVKQGALDEEMERKEAEERAWKKKMELGKDYLEVIRRNEDTQRAEKAKNIMEEQEDITNGEAERKKIEKFTKDEEQQFKKDRMKQFQDFQQQKNEQKKRTTQEDKEQDMVIGIYAEAKHKIECMRKKKEREIQEAMQRRRQMLAKQAAAHVQSKADHEEYILRKAQAESEALEEDKNIKRAQYEKRLVQEREDDYKQYLKREEARKFEEVELKKWEMLNRFKKDQVMTEYENDKARKKWESVLAYRQELLDQIADDPTKQVLQEEEAYHQYQMGKIKDEDRKFFEYANEVMEHAKSKGRMTIPIEHVIDGYKKTYNIPLDKDIKELL